MKQLQKSDLKHGDIYVAGESMTFINKEGTNYYIGYSIIRKPNFYKTGGFTYNAAREATPEEKHWLKECIKADKFVSYKEAMKTFIPEYVECIKVDCDMQLNNIYKVTNSEKWSVPDNGNPYVIYLDSQNLKGATGPFYLTYFKPSTKESYDAQFVVKEPVIYEEPKDKVLQLNQIRGKGTTIVQVQCSEGGIYKIGDKITVFDKISPNKGKPFTIKGFRWNNSKTKLCAVTELHTPNGIGLDKIELYIEPKIEPKQELCLLEQAKLKYPVGTKFINAYKGVDRGIQIIDDSPLKEADFVRGVYWCNAWLYLNDQWAEIVEDFVLPEKWCIRLNLENVNIVGKWFNENSQTRIYDYHKLTLDSVSTIYNILHYPAYKYLGLTKHGDTINKIENGYTEITFEQFKKYVLNEKV